MNSLEDYYLVEEFAKRIGREGSTVRKWIKKQIIPASRLQSVYLIPKKDLAEVLRNNVVGVLRPNKRIFKLIRRGLMKPVQHNQTVLTPHTTAESPGGHYDQDKG